MPTKKIVLLCVISLILGFLGGFCISHFVLPNLWKVEEQIVQQSVYQVEHNVCPVEEQLVECSIFVDISGAIKSPGVYCFDPGQRVVDAIKKAGGFTTSASLEFIYRNINLAKELVANQKVYIPSTSELICNLKEFTLKEEEVIPSTEEANSTGQDIEETDGMDATCININTASITELDSLEGIGISTAQKIIDNRPYSSVTDILNISGIGEATYNKFKDNICI